jgi:ADP-ribosylglycohydrolase
VSEAVITSRQQKTISSSLWAAYGDVLGFPTELAGPSMVKQRLGADRSEHSHAWRRLVGGRFGAQAQLCIGAYSDDTQLRLATSRSIGTDGCFDVESFAKVELPVWLAYSLGAGRGSKAAASALSEPTSNWFSNFYSSSGIEYVNGGGNGAAMRIQPHVWCAPNMADEKAILVSVVRNSVSTHGHIRGIAGAMVHAVALARTMRNDAIPDPSQWIEFADVIRMLPELVTMDSQLATFWLPTWEKLSETDIATATERVANEWISLLTDTEKLYRGDPVGLYFQVVKDLGGLTEKERGSGLKSAYFSLVASWLFRTNGARYCIEIVANYLNSDTDTIATMAGALLGALPNQSPPNDTIQDNEYITSEAVRLFKVSQKNYAGEHFAYPDLLYWQPPKTALDCVGLSQDGYELAGFSSLEPLSEEFPAAQKGTVWQWFRLDFGQTILCKRRQTPKKLPILAARPPLVRQPMKREATPALSESPASSRQAVNADLFPTTNSPAQTTISTERNHESTSIDQLSNKVIRSNFDAKVIGDCLLQICQEDNAIELAIGFSAIVAKARTARMRKAT